MAKASDPRLLDITKRRPSSAPKPGDVSDIPKIILDERKEAQSLSSSLTSSAHSAAFPSTGMNSNIREASKKEPGGNAVHSGQSAGPHMSVRSSSDIGLPAASMPNLAVPLVPGEMSTSETYLEVFCSPRTFRRSVDLDISSKEHARSNFEWVDNLDSSSNCLKVLTSGSRVGSALSLNSECTARSIGLLSNDSDSDNDLSLTESERMSMKPSQLRRFMSYPEDSSSADLCARPSQSMTDLKTMDNTDTDTEQDSNIIHGVPGAADKSGACATDASSGELLHEGRSSSPCDLRLQEKKIRAQKGEIYRDRSKGGVSRPSPMLSYKCDTHDSTRDGRIRQWLQDMDSQD